MKDPKMKCDILFLVTFARVFYNEMFSWLHHTNILTKKAGHICHEVPLRVPMMLQQLIKLKDTWEDPNGLFKDFLLLYNALPDDLYENGERIQGGKQTMRDQVSGFFLISSTR